MTEIINKFLLLFCCLFVYVISHHDVYMVVPVIVVIIISAISSIFDKPAVRIAGLIVFTGLSLFFYPFLYFIPLLLYDVFLKPYALAGLIVIFPAAVNFSEVSWQPYIVLFSIICLALLIKYYAVRLETLKNSYTTMRDNTKEFEFSLEQKNKELLEKQDYEVRLATLNERNRIAREIHDSVGHVMASSILQVGALIATATDNTAKESLITLKNTLTDGMNSIRSSVHDLHADSIDLNSQLYALVKEFTFCPLAFDYDVQNIPPVKLSYSVIAIVKEALSNIIKHSDATAAAIIFRELPGFYQLIISDNGSPENIDAEKGMGIRNVKARIESLNGHVHISSDKGFRIFISIPKEKDS